MKRIINLLVFLFPVVTSLYLMYYFDVIHYVENDILTLIQLFVAECILFEMWTCFYLKMKGKFLTAKFAKFYMSIVNNASIFSLVILFMIDKDYIMLTCYVPILFMRLYQLEKHKAFLDLLTSRINGFVDKLMASGAHWRFYSDEFENDIDFMTYQNSKENRVRVIVFEHDKMHTCVSSTKSEFLEVKKEVHGQIRAMFCDAVELSGNLESTNDFRICEKPMTLEMMQKIISK